MIKNLWLIIALLFLFEACDKDDAAEPEIIVNASSNKDTTRSIEEKFNLTEPYFYTGLINGERVIYQTNGRRDYPPTVSRSRFSSGGIGSRGVTTGFFDILLLHIYYEYGYFGIPDTSQIFYLNKNYTCSNSSNIANDTLRYNLSFRQNGNYYRSDCCPDLNQDATLKFTQFFPPEDRGFPFFDIAARYRCEIDSLFFRAGGDTLIFTDFIIQTEYK
jgi:hypothetical protein